MLLFGALATADATNESNVLVITASNTEQNQLLVCDDSDRLIQTTSTQGQGGVGGNAGLVAAHGQLSAAVDFGSKSVAVFQRGGKGFQFRQLIPTFSSSVSDAFGHAIPTLSEPLIVESHRIYGSHVNGNPDGVVTLIKADGSAAQVRVLNQQLFVTEKSGAIETSNLLDDGSVSGIPNLVQNIPKSLDTPFGLVTRGNNAYVTIAHADEISLVRNGTVLASDVTPLDAEFRGTAALLQLRV